MTSPIEKMIDAACGFDATAGMNRLKENKEFAVLLADVGTAAVEWVNARQSRDSIVFDDRTFKASLALENAARLLRDAGW